MSFEKNVEQDNVVDGTVLAFETVPGEGAYVTVAGRGEAPTILAMDSTDLKVIAQAVLPRVDGCIAVTGDGDSGGLTQAGMERLPKILGLG